MISRTAATPNSRNRTALFCMSMLLFLFSCHCHHKAVWVDDPGYKIPDSTKFPVKDQVVVWKNPNVSEQQFQDWLYDLQKERPGVQALAVCAHCDSDMLLLYDTSLLRYFQFGPANQTAGGNGGT